MMQRLTTFFLTAGLFALTIVPASAFVSAHGSHSTSVRRSHHNLYHIAIGADTSIPTLEIHTFLPNNLTIHAGDSVEWTNPVPDEPQTVTFGPLEAQKPLVANNLVFEINPLIVRPTGGHVVGDVTTHTYSSGALIRGIKGLPDSYTFRFDTVGTYIYRSLFHPDGNATINVAPTSTPASPLHPDTGPSLFTALRSASQILTDVQATNRNGVLTGGGNNKVTVNVGQGDGNVSLNSFFPAGLNVPMSTTVTWTTPETSGDPHILIFQPTQTDTNNQRVYTGLSSSSALQVNPSYQTPTLQAMTIVMTGTLPAGARSPILYGSSANAQSLTATSFSITFGAPGEYDYIDAFHPGVGGVVIVRPAGS